MAHLATEAFSQTYDVALVVRCGLDEFLLRVRVKLIDH